MSLIRKLRDYRWELRGHKVTLIDFKNNKEIEIDKVRLMSFMKFSVNCMDKMRIDDLKKLRKQIADAKAKAKAKKIFKGKLVEARASIKKALDEK